MKKKIKIKIKIIPILLLLMIIALPAYVFLFGKRTAEPKEIIPKINEEEEVYNILKNNDITLEFINWVSNNYKGSITKLYSLLKTNEYNKTMWHDVTDNSLLVLNDLYNKTYDNKNNIKTLSSVGEATISIVGDISLADNWYIAPEYDRVGNINGILAPEVVEIMKNSTVMIGNSEFTVSKRGNPLNGKQYTFRAKPERLAIYDEMGMDLVTLANNHVYDFGQDAFFDMLDSFKTKGLPYIGAGKNLEEASSPYYFIINGYKFAFINASRAEKYRLTPGATETSEGIFLCYDPTNVINKIKEIRPEADFVVTIIHFGTEWTNVLEDVQISSSHAYIDAGADMVVGHHAHTLQGIEFYNDKPIIYNLGNFIFNSLTADTAIFQIKVTHDGTLEYYMIPAIQENCHTRLLQDTEKQRVINNINSWSSNASLDSNGKLIKK